MRRENVQIFRCTAIYDFRNANGRRSEDTTTTQIAGSLWILKISCPGHSYLHQNVRVPRVWLSLKSTKPSWRCRNVEFDERGRWEVWGPHNTVPVTYESLRLRQIYCKTWGSDKQVCCSSACLVLLLQGPGREQSQALKGLGVSGPPTTYIFKPFSQHSSENTDNGRNPKKKTI